MTKVKLCGMMRPLDIEAVNELKPEYIGFIFWEKSFRNLSFEKASELKGLLNPEIQAVGVFVDPPMDMVVSLVNEGVIDVVQLHGSESNEYIDELRTKIKPGTKVIKAFKVTTPEEVKASEASKADYLLFDPGKGSGNTFNWELIKNVKRDYFLAGGLNCENIEEAVTFLHPYAVDVSSGIETEKQKDADKMKRFVKTVRSLTERN